MALRVQPIGSLIYDKCGKGDGHGDGAEEQDVA